MNYSVRRLLLLTALVTVCVVSTPFATPWQQAGDPPVTAETLVRHVRQALGRGAVARARTMAMATEAPPEVRGVATALVDLFEGQTGRARDTLTPLADAGSPDALLELGLLELEEGRREAGRRRIGQLLEQRFDMTPESTFRMARAAYALGDVRQANTFFQRVGTGGTWFGSNGPMPLQHADMETTWGDMLREKHQNTDSARSYRAALDADPAWVRAHLGLARLLRDEDPTASAAAMARAIELAPEHPDVLLVTADRELAAEDRDAARQALDKLKAVRPGMFDEIALRAAIAYADGEIAQAETMVAEAVQRNLLFAQGYRALATQAARAYRSEDAAAYARQAVALDPEHANAHADLGVYLMRTGDEAAAREELERAFRLDPFNTVTFNQLQLLDTLDSFVEVEHGPFLFKFAKDEAEVLKPYALPLADRAFATFVDRYGFTPEGPILVEVFSKHDDFAVRTLGLPGLVGALGACFGRVITMVSPKTMRETGAQSNFSWQATLWHEIAHVFTLQASNYKVPRWLTEGISVYEEHREQTPWGRELTLEYAAARAEKRAFGVKGLPDAFKRPRDLALAYFEASLLTEHLVSLNGEAGLRSLLAAYRNGAKDGEAFAQAFGKSVDDVSASFEAFVDERYGALTAAMAPVPNPDGEPSIDTLKALAEKQPGSYRVQIALGQELVEAGELEAATGPLQRAAALAPMARGEDSPNALLAEIAEKQQDNAAAMEAWLRLIEADHDNVDAAQRLLVTARASRDVAAESAALKLIASVDPFDATAHALLGRQALARKEYDVALIELQVALALGPPNAAEAQADIAEAYLGLGRRDEARKAALRALEYAPTFPRAQDLLLAAIGGGL